MLVVTYTVQDGKSNYLEGAMVSNKPTEKRDRTKLMVVQLMALYIIIAVAFFVTPSGALDDNALGF